MKTINKNILKSLLSLLMIFTFNTISAQLSVYTGTWHYQNNNQLFIVNIWMEGNSRYGHYKMVEFNNGIIGDIIYDSHRDYGNGNKHYSTIFASESGQYGLIGNICDNIAIDNCKTGDFEMKVLPQNPGCSSCPVTATWKVTEPMRDLIVSDEPPFSIPTDIVLTKVN